VKRIAKRQKSKQIQLWFQDEARVGQKGRNAHVWCEKGVRPVMRTDKRFKSVYIYGAIRPGTDDAFALILPRADTEMMRLYLDTFAQRACPPMSTSCWCSTRPDGTSLGGSNRPTTSHLFTYRPIHQNSTRSSVSGSTSRSASSRIALTLPLVPNPV